MDSESPPEGTKSTKETWALAIDYIVQRKRFEQALGFLSQASAILAGSVDYHATLASVAQLSVPFLADWCSIDLLDAGGVLRQIAVERSDATDAIEGPLRRLLYPQRRPLEGGVLAVLESGRGELVLGAADPAGPERARVMDELGVTSVIVAPVLERGTVRGTIALAALRIGNGRVFGRGEQALAEQLALRVAAAVEIGRFHGIA